LVIKGGEFVSPSPQPLPDGLPAFGGLTIVFIYLDAGRNFPRPTVRCFFKVGKPLPSKVPVRAMSLSI
jgi:hypothetical protein